MDLPLAQYDIDASPFSLLDVEEEQVILIAEDFGHPHTASIVKQNSLQPPLHQQERDEHVHVLLDESSDPIFSFKEDGTYLYVNNIFASTLGYTQEDIIGKKIWDIFPKEEADKRFAMVQKVFATGETENIEVRIPLEAGDKYFLTTVKPIQDKSDNVSFIICISKDITELRETQDQLKILQGILPICAACKNIRNDKGAWLQLEEYISLHSEAVFTHGICPDCAHKLYPEMDI